MTKSIEEPDLRTTIERDIHEHEVFISFVNDEDAVLFHEWWQAHGWKAFKKWAEHVKSEEGR